MRFSSPQISDAIEGARKLRAYAYPGIEGATIAFRCLSESELDGVEAGALAEMEKLGKARKWDLVTMMSAAPELYERILQRAIVYLAAFDAETMDAAEPVRFFSKPAEIAGVDTGTVTKLFGLYCEHQSWTNPLHGLDDAGVQELADALGKGSGAAEYLAGYERSTLVRLLIALASRASTP